MKRLFYILFGALLIAGCSHLTGPGEYSRTEPLMGTFVQVKVAAPGRSKAQLKEAAQAALALARRLEQRFSVFYPLSEVNALNIAKTQKVSTELFDLIEKANSISSETGGEFDITVAPILKANGFYEDMPAEIRDKIPEGFGGVGWENVTLNLQERLVTLQNGAWIDLSGIAKGYIVDRIAKFLKKKGITACLINAGGDIYCGDKDRSGIWNIGVREPASMRVVIVLGIRDMAVATSGDYENVVIDKDTGEAVSHIIDPSVDKARAEVPSSVTVIAPTCIVADALATGMMAMGPGKAITLADTLDNVEVITLAYSGGKLKIDFSKGAEKYVVRR
ncbi:MAG: FAD:protein FMN transferase [Candidatus Omnitrophota bacterium]